MKVRFRDVSMRFGEVEVLELRKDKPTVYVFVQAEKWERPMFRFIKAVEEKVGDAPLPPFCDSAQFKSARNCA